MPLLVVLLVDWWTRVIYTNWIAAGVVLALAIAAFDGVRSLLEALAGLAIGAAVFGAFYILALLLYRDVRVVSLGAGDVWLAAMIGAMTGDVLAAIGTLFYGILLAALGAGVLLACSPWHSGPCPAFWGVPLCGCVGWARLAGLVAPP